MTQQPEFQTSREVLISELRQLGIKHTPERIVRISKQPDNKIVFLEEGNSDAGLQHILENHLEQFTDLGIEADQIPDVVIAAVTQGKMIGYQGRKKTRVIYEINFNNRLQYIAVTVSNNGYIVGANPRTAQ